MQAFNDTSIICKCSFLWLVNKRTLKKFRYLLLYIQQDETLHSLFISGNCSTCFGWYHHPTSGGQTTVSTASGICHTVTATCRYISNKMQLYTVYLYLETALLVSGSITTHHQKRKQLYLQHLVFVTTLLLPATNAASGR
jgi:hypothetical protein